LERLLRSKRLYFNVMNIFKITYFLQKGDKSLFSYPIEEEYAYMDSLGDPKNDIDRSYKQYLCQRFFMPMWKRPLLSVVSLFVAPFCTVYLLLKGFFIKFSSHSETIIEDKGMNEVIPDSLKRNYSLDSSAWHSGMGLSWRDVNYVFAHLIGWYDPYFILKSIVKIASYSAMITRHSPLSIIVNGEYSFCSSLLTDYCHSRNVEHINVMHGEKLRFIRDSFFHFDRCFVWDQYYVNLFIRQKAEPTQFVVSIPESLNINISEHYKPSAFANYKYYLALYTEDELKSIVASMAFSEGEGKTVKYRPHPRYSDMILLKKYVPEDLIEMPSEVSIIDSVANLDSAIGSYTTVLLQAHLSGKNVLLDDVTYKERYGRLVEYGYILSGNMNNVNKLSDKQ